MSAVEKPVETTGSGSTLPQAVVEELARLRLENAKLSAEMAKQNNTITWDTTCHGCAAEREAAYAEHCRAEEAKGLLADAVRLVCDGASDQDIAEWLVNVRVWTGDVQAGVTEVVEVAPKKRCGDVLDIDAAVGVRCVRDEHPVQEEHYRPCPHEHFEATVEINRIAATPDQVPTAYVADIRVACGQCGEPFRWSGVRAGMSFAEPRVSVDETELHAPLRPASADPDFGMGLPGFAITVRSDG